MKKWLQISFVSLALLLAVGHSLLPHIHDLSEAFDHRHDNDHPDKLVHFGALDDSFVPAKYQNNFSQQDLVLECIIFHYELSFQLDSSQRPLSLFEEYPPPDEFLYTSSLRGPPRS